MARTRILLDSNAYFRLAQSIHPLLDAEFGGERRYCLYVIQELADEYARSPRLQRKFTWVDQPQYRENRQRWLKCSRDEKKRIDLAVQYLGAHARDNALGVSGVDVRALAVAFVLGIDLVTDDQAMAALAKDFQIPVLTTLALLRRMLDENHVTMEKVREIAAYWRYAKDTPAGFAGEYRRAFREPPPDP